MARIAPTGTHRMDMLTNIVRGREPIRRVVFGIRNIAGAKVVVDKLRARGLEIAFVSNADDACRLAVGRTDTAVVVPVASEAEGGFLPTAKLVTALPHARVILVATRHDERIVQFAEFIDATLVIEDDGPDLLLKAVLA